MKRIIGIAVAILALCLAIAAILISERYDFFRLSDCNVARADRWTGKVETVWLCSVWDDPSIWGNSK